MDCGIGLGVNPDLRPGIRSQSLLSGKAMIGVHGDHNAIPMAYDGPAGENNQQLFTQVSQIRFMTNYSAFIMTIKYTLASMRY